ncbi:mitochondrial protein Pet127-domain-containing protein [Pestalotiopsis sp. NC0098]|nr:mitochondrial protein Pet127-domain-containing protein [Pestalotiopsis sp. NC0098]
MLRLRSQAIHRLGIPSTCPSCLAAARPPVAARLRPSIASSQLSVYTQRNRFFTASTTLFDAETTKDSSGDPKSSTGASKKKSKKKKKATPKPSAQKDAPPAEVDQSQQLAVLQGALTALKKVLEEQNINYDGAKTATKGKKKSAKPPQPAKSKPEPKSESKAAPAPTAASSNKPPKPKKTKKKQPDAQAKPEATSGDGQDDALDAALAKYRPNPEGKKSRPPNRAARRADLAKGLLAAKLARKASAAKKAETKAAAPGRKAAAKSRDVKTAPEPEGPSDTQPLHISVLNADELHLVPIDKPQPPVPCLSYGLERALFNPGVYNLQDPRSKVFNFDPYLANIMPIKEFDFDALKAYITSSKDEALIGVAREHGKKYTGSTSSMTAALSHFHYLLSSWREINSGMMSQEFELPSKNFTNLLRSPAATFLHYKDGVYAIDADKEFDSANVLSMLGKSMEKLLTLPREEYERYRRENSHQISEEERNADEAYHYTGLGDFMMRSQLDAYDPRVPGTGMFDLKTRAVVSIRMDVKGFTQGLGYELRHRQGNWESYEREYHDMIRAAFLKYSLQVRMGRMDGIFVAFHNTQRIFGFQYIPIDEMDLSLHGTTDTTLGDKEFKLSLSLFNKLLDRATEKFPKQSLRLFVETRTSANTPFMYAFMKPVTPEEIETVQNTNKASAELVERQLLGLTDSMLEEAEAATEGDTAETLEEQRENELEEEEEEDDDDVVSWDEIQVMVEDAMEDDELGIGAVRQAIEDALEESGLLDVQSPEESRAYVNALLSAVTGDSQEAATEGIDQVDEETQSSSESDASKDAESKDSTGESASPNMSTLSNAILRMTRQIDEKGSLEEEEPDAAVSSKLKNFEQILSKIISESREDDQGAEVKAGEDAAGVASESVDKIAAERAADEASAEVAATEPADLEDEPKEQGPLLGMVLTVRNKVNGKYVTRPENLTKDDVWDIEYNIEELPDERAARLFEQCKKRRKKAYRPEGRTRMWHTMFDGALPKYTEEGRAFRDRENEMAKNRPVHIMGIDKPLKYQEVFGGDKKA